MKVIEEISDMSHEDIARIIGNLRQRIGYLQMANTKKQAQIRHFRIRLLKIRRDIDYMLAHPFSVATGNRTRIVEEYKVVEQPKTIETTEERENGNNGE